MDWWFKFTDAPLCATDKVVIVGAFRNENLNIYCEVQADPPPRFVLPHRIACLYLLLLGKPTNVIASKQTKIAPVIYAIIARHCVVNWERFPFDFICQMAKFFGIQNSHSTNYSMKTETLTYDERILVWVEADSKQQL